MKRTPMKRAAFKRSKRKSKYASRQRAPESWWLFVKSEFCLVRVIADLRALGIEPVIPGMDAASIRAVMLLMKDTPCRGEIEADHVGARGLGRKCKDYEVASLCTGHHEDRTNGKGLRGAFANFNRVTMRLFVVVAIAWTHRNARTRGVEIPTC